MSFQIRWLIILIFLMVLLSLMVSVLHFLKKVKTVKAKIVMDRLSIFSVGVIAFLFAGYHVDLIVEINTLTDAMVYVDAITFTILGFGLYFLLSQNFFAYTDDLIMTFSRCYNRSQIKVTSIKHAFADRVLIKAVDTEGKYVETHMLFRLTRSNYDRYKDLFDE